MKRAALFFVLVLGALLYGVASEAQQTSTSQAPARSKAAQPSPKSKKQKKAKGPSITAKPILPVTGFQPTCNLDSNSVGFYFFPANLGAKWTMRVIMQTFDASNNLVRSDTAYSFERVVSDSNKTLQGLPELICESSSRYRLGHEDSVRTQPVEYYVDDSVIMAVFNHSISNELNHTLLLNPLKVGSMWRETSADTAHSTIIASHEPVAVPFGTFDSSIVVQSKVGFGELSKYFVGGVGIVKSVYRGIAPSQNGTFVMTSELIALESGEGKRSIKYRFAKPVPPTKASPFKLVPKGASEKNEQQSPKKQLSISQRRRIMNRFPTQTSKVFDLSFQRGTTCQQFVRMK